MSDIELWKTTIETRKFQEHVKQEIDTIKEDLCSGVLLLHKDLDKIALEYAGNIGKLEGLKVLESYISIEDKDHESETVFRSDNS